ncbi:von Willebrand factor D and EGF domain-containing protein [Neoarius graeffei]|uniref:von Willebrand factor D and EGF domain-containing protein n=1 Tax=Neoarius graeffei TaxID=443677 RepID=UPI00298CCEEC|nr:von Willebrand factor D and EGF domain-containing protein [Neoarius graeffei]
MRAETGLRFLCLAAVLYTAQSVEPPECNPGGHMVLQNPYRSTSFSSQQLLQSGLQEKLICDHSLTPGWYKLQIFDKPAQMPTKCVEVNHCGTQAPVWLSLAEGETLPHPMEVKRLTACATWQLFSRPKKECCLFRMPVSVRNCGQFYVYQLQPTQGCMAYCAEEISDSTEPVCEPEHRNRDGSCNDKQPPSPSVPEIVAELSGPSILLKCTFDGHSVNSSLGFVVTWWRLSPNGNKEELMQETTLQTSAFIELDGINLRLGDRIFCSCSSFFLDAPDRQSHAVESAEFFAGIQLQPKLASILEDGKEHELVIQSTVPVPCLSETCTLLLQLRTSSQGEEVLGPDLVLSSCEVKLSHAPCQKEVCSQALLHYSAVTDISKDGDRSTEISIKPIVSTDFLWNGYTPESVQITVKDILPAYCYIFTDPHIITFDGRKYDNFHIGTFVLYRSTIRLFEVHVRQWECASTTAHPTSCVCGFAARDGAEVISFDMCHGLAGETKPRLLVKNGDLAKSGIRITESYQGRKVTLTFSSGAFVRADVADWGMSLTVMAPGSDQSHTEGLCGTFDGQPLNDYHRAGGETLEDSISFINTWRLAPSSSFFDKIPAYESRMSFRHFCHCEKEPHQLNLRARLPSSPFSCSRLAHFRTPSIIPARDVTAEYIRPIKHFTGSAGNHAKAHQDDTETQNRGRLQDHKQAPFSPAYQSVSQSDQESFNYFFPEDQVLSTHPELPAPTWPTESGLTEVDAQQLCGHALYNSTVALGCVGLLDKVMEKALEMCVVDQQLKDERTWLGATVPLLENECERRVMQEEGRREELRDVFTFLRCPNLCSGNGQCTERGCMCFPGFGSYDCSQVSDQIPEITELEGGGLCDLKHSSCSTVKVVGKGFRNAFELKCEVMKEKIVDGEWSLSDPVMVPALFLSSSALECQLPVDDVHSAGVHHPPVTRWQIKVSNDGYSFSNAKIFTLFDGTCQECTHSSGVQCTLKNSSCNIDGQCYGESERSPSSPCLICRPDLSKYTWSVSEKNKPPVFHSEQTHLQTFYGENFVYQFVSTDPEGSAVLFTLLSGPKDAVLSPAGLLIWKALSSSLVTFELAVRDDCNAETQAMVKVSVRHCDCYNGASCVTNMNFPPGSGEYLCVCPAGLEGEKCLVNVNDCKSNPCQRGECVEGLNSFTCLCPAGFTGVTCEEDIDECLSAPCFPGVPCTNTLGSFVCGSCPDHFTGDGKNCIRKTRHRDHTGDQGLNLRHFKPNLDPAQSQCSSQPCYPGVQCFESVYTSAGYICGPCPPGLHGNGQNCMSRPENRLTPGTREGNRPDVLFSSSFSISSSSQKSTESSIIAERPLFNKKIPSLIDRKTSLSPVNHDNSPTKASGSGGQLHEEDSESVVEDGRTCSDSSCFPGVPCEPSAAGHFKCGRCPNGYRGDGVTCKAMCRYPCGQNMECTLPNTCTCKEGYTGYNCHIAICRPDCKNRGRCVKPNVCECPAGYSGPTCEEATCDPLCQNGGSCLSRNLCTCSFGYVGPRCEIMVCTRHCENGGECVSPEVCKCKPGWYGPTCNSADCKPVCLNGGTCIKPNICTCPRGFYGSQCQIAVCNPPCKNRGQCMRNNVCSCPEGYTGKRCQMSVCDPMCMNKGKCVGPNTCSCASGWWGGICNIPVCLQKCKNGGECVGPNMCHCPAGWEGIQCQTPTCKHKCQNGGKCVLPNFCQCRSGYTGSTCAAKTR